MRQVNLIKIYSAVTVEPFLKDGWETWGQTFIEYLIGTIDNASRCTIQNKEVVHFRAISEKLANLLPLDYWPENENDTGSP